MPSSSDLLEQAVLPIRLWTNHETLSKIFDLALRIGELLHPKIARSHVHCLRSSSLWASDEVPVEPLLEFCLAFAKA